ncbi:hypothetical protein ACJJTC_013046 [Scirpophaga incertulas]
MKFRKALHKAKSGKASGPDDVHIEVLKLVDEENLDGLVKLLNLVYDTGWPKSQSYINSKETEDLLSWSCAPTPKLRPPATNNDGQSCRKEKGRRQENVMVAKHQAVDWD